MDEWKSIPSLNGRYEANANGKIRNATTKKILKQFTNKHGYKVLTVRPNPNNQENARVHKLVSEAFLGKCPSGYVVNHIDGDKSNNNIENLEYVTPSQNNIHALRNNLRKPSNPRKYVKRGEDSNFAKITEKDVNNIMLLHEETGYGCRKLSKITGISRGAISNILCGRSWKHITNNYFAKKEKCK